MKMAKTENMKMYEKYKAKTKKIDEQKKVRAEEINLFYDTEIKNCPDDKDFLESLRKADLKNLDKEFAGKKAEIKNKLFAPAEADAEQEKEQQEKGEEEQAEQEQEEQEESEEDASIADDVTDSVHTHEKVELSNDKKEQVEKVAKVLNNLWKKKALNMSRSRGAEQQTTDADEAEFVDVELVDWEVA